MQCNLPAKHWWQQAWPSGSNLEFSFLLKDISDMWRSWGSNQQPCDNWTTKASYLEYRHESGITFKAGTLSIIIIFILLRMWMWEVYWITSSWPVDAPLAELLARQGEVSQVCVSQTLDQILLYASSCSYDHIHLTQSIKTEKLMQSSCQMVDCFRVETTGRHLNCEQTWMIKIMY